MSLSAVHPHCKCSLCEVMRQPTGRTDSRLGLMPPPSVEPGSTHLGGHALRPVYRRGRGYPEAWDLAVSNRLDKTVN